MKRFLKYDTEITKKENGPVDKNGLIKENIVGGGSSVQPDWNQNDSTQPDYVKNRPFYTGNPVETVLVEEQTVAFSYMDGAYAVQGWPTEFDAVVGETYTVSWDGTEYECECLSMKSLTYIGNLAVAGFEIDTGEPFVFVNQGSWVVATNDTASEHSISVSSIVHPVTKIDEKYLPKASENSYGIIKTSDVVSAYNFPVLAQHDQMVDAIAAFKTGNASIVWNGVNVIHAKYNSSSDTISVVFAKEPMRLHTYSNDSGFYNKNLGSSTYGELQGNKVRIVNDKEAYTLLSTEGVQSDTILRVVAKKLSVSGEIGGDALVLMSSTYGSTKKFKITVDDSGAITAAEVS